MLDEASQGHGPLLGHRNMVSSGVHHGGCIRTIVDEGATPILPHDRIQTPQVMHDGRLNLGLIQELQ